MQSSSSESWYIYKLSEVELCIRTSTAASLILIVYVKKSAIFQHVVTLPAGKLIRRLFILVLSGWWHQ